MEHVGVQAQHAARHGVVGIADLQVGGLADHVLDLFLELGGPQVRVFDLDLVDDVDAEVHVHGLIAHDVLDLFGGTGQAVLAAKGQQLHKADVEEDALEDHVEGDQVTQQALVVFRCASVEHRVGQ